MHVIEQADFWGRIAKPKFDTALFKASLPPQPNPNPPPTPTPPNKKACMAPTLFHSGPKPLVRSRHSTGLFGENQGSWCLKPSWAVVRVWQASVGPQVRVCVRASRILDLAGMAVCSPSEFHFVCFGEDHFSILVVDTKFGLLLGHPLSKRVWHH